MANSERILHKFLLAYLMILMIYMKYPVWKWVNISSTLMNGWRQFNNAKIGPIQFIALKEGEGEKPSKENTDRIFFPYAP